MDKPKLRIKDDPERRVRDEVRDYLVLRGWFVKITHGSVYSEGLPDIIACHNTYGQRFIEVKLPNMKGSRFTPAQLRDFPQFVSHGCGIWIITGGNEEEYQKLFKPQNLWYYLDAWKG